MQRSLRLWLSLAAVALMGAGAAMFIVQRKAAEPALQSGLYGPVAQTAAQFETPKPIRPKLEPAVPQGPSVATPPPVLQQGPQLPVKLLAYA